MRDFPLTGAVYLFHFFKAKLLKNKEKLFKSLTKSAQALFYPPQFFTASQNCGG
jgi:hypothetical protein